MSTHRIIEGRGDPRRPLSTRGDIGGTWIVGRPMIEVDGTAGTVTVVVDREEADRR